MNVTRIVTRILVTCIASSLILAMATIGTDIDHQHSQLDQILATVDNAKFGDDDVNIAYLAIKTLNAQWRDIGLALGLTGDTLDEIAGNYNETTDRLSRILTLWVRQNYDTLKFPLPSWRSLCKALAKVSNNKRFIKDLALEHGVDTNQSVVQRSSISQHTHWKRELVQLFEGITSREVSKDQLEKLAKQCIRNGGTYKERYLLVELEKLLDENQTLGGADCHNLMTSSFDGLSKYILNLIIPKRPPRWRSINTASAFFKTHVMCMKGYEGILQIAGYTEKKGISLQFPDAIQEPDKATLSVLAAELLMAKIEVEQMNSTDGDDTKSIAVTVLDSMKERKSSTAHYSPSDKVANSAIAWYNGSKFCFVNPQSARNLSCQQCKNIAYEPYQCDCCQSLFCQQCVFPKQCPSCNEDKCFLDLRSNLLIQNLMVWCPNSVDDGLGCEWKGELREVPHHRQECPLEKVSCLYSVVGCSAGKMFRNKLEEHEVDSREIHLNLAMKEVISMKATIKNLTETVEQLKEEHEMYI